MRNPRGFLGVSFFGSSGQSVGHSGVRGRPLMKEDCRIYEKKQPFCRPLSAGFGPKYSRINKFCSVFRSKMAVKQGRNPSPHPRIPTDSAEEA